MMLKKILSFLVLNYLFCTSSIFADVTITSGVGDVNLPAGGGTATAASDVTRTGRVYGADGNGYWSLVNNGNINPAGDIAVFLQNVTGGTITNAGTAVISAGHDYAVDIEGDGTITNSGSAVISAGAGYGILIKGNGTITNQDSAHISAEYMCGFSILGDGTITNSDNAVISSGNTYAALIYGEGTLVNSGNAVISAAFNGALQFRSGFATITNSGNAVISAGNSNAVECYAGSVTNSDNAIISATNYNALNFDTDGNIINRNNAHISSGIDGGISIYHDGNITNSDNALISAGRNYGVDIKGNGTITNSDSGVISAGHDYAVRIEGDGTITNSGSAVITAEHYYGILIKGNGTITNQDSAQISAELMCGFSILGDGTITNSDNAVISSGYNYAALIYGEGTLVNSGNAVISAAFNGALQFRSGFATITNSGNAVISAGNSNAVECYAGSVTNSDNAIISATNYNALNFDTDGNIINRNNAHISSGIDGGINIYHDGNITNSDTAVIYAEHDYAVKIEGDGTITNSDSAVISAGRNYGIFTNGNGTIINSGNAEISAGSLYGIFIDGNGSIINSDNALIHSGDYCGIRINGTGTVTNSDSAMISSSGSNGVYISGNATVNNSENAVISSEDYYALLIDGVGTVTNSGTISAGRNYGVCFNGVDTSDTLYNSGIIAGNPIAVDMGSGDDLVVLQTGSQISGIIDGGVNADTLRLQGTGTLNSPVQNFELLEKNDPGTWEINNDINVNTTTVNEGALQINSGGNLNSPFFTILCAGSIVNNGTISVSSGINFASVNTTDSLYNSGTIIGNPIAVDMGSGDDLVVLQTGSQISGIIDGGANTDTLRLRGAGILNSPVQNFELLEKNDPGTWEINNDINVNTTMVNEGTLQINSGGNLNSPVFTILCAGSIVNNGTISVSSGINFAGLNTADSLYNSGTIIGNSIAVDMGSGDDLVVLQTGSQIYGIMDGGADTDLLCLDGSGTLNNEVQNFELLEKTGAGTWTINTDLSVYSTFVEQGSLAINSGGVLTTSDITIADNAELVMQGGTLNSDNLWLMDGAGFIYNGGDLNVSNFDCGTLSSLNINSDLDCPGDLNVNGPVVINDTLTCPSLTIFGNGSFSGNGNVNGLVTNYGILSPGNSIGTLTVSGNYTQNNGSFNIETNPSGSSDKLYVSGHSVFNNTQLNVYTQAGHYYAHTVYAVVTSYSGLTGTFTLNAQDLTPLLYWGYKLSSNKLSLEVLRRSYTAFAETPNQFAMAQALDAIEGKAAGDFSTVLDVVDYFNEQGIAYALDSFSPASSDAFAAGTLASSYYFDDSIRNYLNEKAFFSDPKNWKEGQTHVWANAFSSKEELEGTTGISGYEHTLNGMAAGADKRFRDNFLAGISAGVSDTDLNWTHSLNQGNTNSLHLGIYGQWKTEPLLFNAVLGYGNNSHEGKRFIEFADISRRAEIDYDSADYSASLGAAKNFTFNRFTLGIFDSLSYILLKEEGYTETGADSLNLKISERDSESFKNDLGFKASLPLMYKEISFIPNAELSWVHEFKDEARDITGAFLDYPADSFSVSGLSREADLFQGQIGLSVLPFENFIFSVSYETALNDSEQSLSVWRISARMAI